MRRTALKRFAPLRRSMRRIRPRRPKTQPDPNRSTAYRAFIRALPCSVWECDRPSQVAHTGGHGYGVKSPDCQAIPLCNHHHNWPFPDAYHTLGRRRFEERHSVRVDSIVSDLNRLWFEMEIRR